MHPAEIQAALKKKGLKQADIARQCEVTPTTVGDVIHGRSRSRAVEARLAQEIGLPESTLWPQWYGATSPGRDQLATITRDEGLLLRSYRELTIEQKARALAHVQALESGGEAPSSGTIAGSKNVTASGAGASAAGRDIKRTTSSK